MFKRILSKKKTASADLELLEKMLSTSLTPVVPRSEFVTGLRSQLLWSDLSDQLSQPAVKVPRTLLVVGGIVGSVLVLLTSIRGLISLLGVLGLVRQQLRRAQPPKTAPVL